MEKQVKEQKPMMNSDVIGLMGLVSRLKTVERAGWNRKGEKGGLSKTRRVKDPESVGDHTFSTGMLGLMLVPRLGISSEDQLKLFVMLMIHDLPEAIIGDWIVYNKDNLVDSEKQRLKKQQEMGAAHQIFSSYNAPHEWLQLWQEFDDNETELARLAHQLDKLDAVLQAYWYATCAKQQSQPQEFWDAARRALQHPVLVDFLNDTPSAYAKLKKGVDK